MKYQIYTYLTKSIFNYILLACIFSLTGCKNDDPRKVLRLDERVVEFCVFKEGSFWIYRNNQNPFLDTVRVVTFRRGITEDGIIEVDDWESVVMNMDWSFYPRDPQITPPRRFIKAESFNASASGVKTFVYEEYPWLMGIKFVTFVHMDSVGQRLIENNNILTLENIHKTYTIQDSTYFSVWEFSLSKYVTDTAPKSVFWAKNIGMIKWISQDSAVMELVEYEVNQ